MKKILLIFISMVWIVGTQAQLFNKKVNRFGEDGLKTGKWITYWDEEEKVPMSIARFDHGKEIGVSKEFHQNGELRMKFRHQKDRIRVKYYSNERKLEQKGWARMEYSKDNVRYYWHGKWKFYNDKRKLVRVTMYQNGEEVLSAIQ
ncbi:MAG TPA: hypothetical protein P5514_04325 [Bacteroidales bacterium]|nr:hypothetical protein [Bacteroidales bacterium]HRX96145.1 hypothetical protein [Bacteroidales bacterium]